MTSLANPVIGIIMLVLFGVFYWLAIFATIRAILAFVGTILLAESGFIGHALGDVARWLSEISGSATNWAFGTSVIAIAAIVAGVVFIHDLMPKHTAGKRTGWAGIVLAALIVAGVTGIPALNHLGPAVQHGVSNAKQIGG